MYTRIHEGPRPKQLQNRVMIDPIGQEQNCGPKEFELGFGCISM